MTQRPLRKDAQRTRELVLEAARELYAEHGLDVGFEKIARAAGVGVGTVYRRFPDRDALVEALFADKANQMQAVVEQALDRADPWEAFVVFCENVVARMRVDRGLFEVLMRSAGNGRPVADEVRARMEGHVDELLARARGAGVVRDGLEGADLMLILHLIARISTAEMPDLWRRYLALFIDGVRGGRDLDALPGAAPTVAMFEEIAGLR